jgi:molybdate transport system ATP-binding protein
MSASPPIFDIDLKIPLQEFNLELAYSGSPRSLGLFGVSGSGKTTFLECLAGLRRREFGQVAFEGEPWLDSTKGIRIKSRYRNVGYVAQDHLLFPRRDVRSNLEAGKKRLLENGLNFEEVFRNVISILELETLLDRKVELLSGGERQRVALGRALCSGPRLLLLDEPLASLDTGLRRRILPYLMKVRDAFRIPMVVVSHNPLELQALCDEVLVVSRGRLIGKGSPDEVFSAAGVFELAKEGGFENVLTGTVLECNNRTDTVSIGETGGSVSIRVPTTGEKVGQRVFCSIASGDAILSVQEPAGLSARNCLQGKVEAIFDSGSSILSRVEVLEGGPAMIVELTQDAVDDLKLAIGSDVYIIFKTNSVRILV